MENFQKLDSRNEKIENDASYVKVRAINQRELRIGEPKHLRLFDDLKIDIEDEEFPGYEEELFKPIEFDKPLQRLLYNEADVINSLKRLRELVEKKNRFNNALARVEQTIRYLSGYLPDYDIEVKRKITKQYIEVTIRVNVYNDLVDQETEIREIAKALKTMFPDANEETCEEAARRIVENVMRAAPHASA